ncbi:MAG: hypothetical protein RL641_211 [Candidatus Parcubacteria bacterium]
MGKVALVSAGLIAAGAATYFLSDKKRRANAKAWMVKMKAETVKKFNSMESMSKDMYHDAIDKVAAKYKAVRDASPAEIAALVIEMKKHWASVSKSKAKSGVKKAAKKVAKKTVKKTVKN